MFLNRKYNWKHNSPVAKSVSMGGWGMDKSWLVHPSRQGFPLPPSFLTKARSMGWKVGAVKVSAGSR